MLTKKDIETYIAEDNKRMDAESKDFRRLSIEEKIKQHKAIKGLRHDSSFQKTSGDYTLCRFLTDSNQSGLNIGDSILVNGAEATLWDFDEEGNIIVAFYGYNWFSEETENVIEKNYGNFLVPIYSRFAADLPDEDDKFWTSGILPARSEVEFDGNPVKWEEHVCSIEKELGVNLFDCQRKAIAKAFASKDYYMLQGPPGTGKSFVIGIIATMLAFKFQQRVCIAGPNYMAINNALVKCAELVPECAKGIFKVGYPYQTTGLTFKINEEEHTIMNLSSYLSVSKINELHGLIMGMTPYTFYSSRAQGLKFDTIIIDEAGQMSVPVAMMGAINADKIIFCGDHKQLAPIIKTENIKEALHKSIFEYMIMENNCSMLDLSFRMNGTICKLVSDLFYEGKLKSYNPDRILNIDIDDPLLSGKFPVVAKNVKGFGTQFSIEEAESIKDILCEYMNLGVPPERIGILAPFRAQCSEIRRTIGKSDQIPVNYRKGIVIDTIDKLQGQEREIIILSLTSGNLEYINELTEFLYNPNKLNVALSRAKCKLILIGNFNIISQMDAYAGSYIERILTHPSVTLV